MVQQIDLERKELKVQFWVRNENEFKQTGDGMTIAANGEQKPTKTISFDFWVGYFDFPMIDHTRLSNDQRCAIVLNALNDTSAHLTLIYFPGSYASIREKPYFEELVERLLV